MCPTPTGGGFFKPDPKMPKKRLPQKAEMRSKKAEVHLKKILWQQHEEQIKKSLHDDLGEEPTAEDVETVFNSMMERLQKEGTFQQMLDEYCNQKIAVQKEKSGYGGRGEETGPTHENMPG